VTNSHIIGMKWCFALAATLYSCVAAHIKLELTKAPLSQDRASLVHQASTLRDKYGQVVLYNEKHV